MEIGKENFWCVLLVKRTLHRGCLARARIANRISLLCQKRHAATWIHEEAFNNQRPQAARRYYYNATLDINAFTTRCVVITRPAPTSFASGFNFIGTTTTALQIPPLLVSSLGALYRVSPFHLCLYLLPRSFLPLSWSRCCFPQHRIAIRKRASQNSVLFAPPLSLRDPYFPQRNTCPPCFTAASLN